jgi:hypothetical protein
MAAPCGGRLDQLHKASDHGSGPRRCCEGECDPVCQLMREATRSRQDPIRLTKRCAPEAMPAKPQLFRDGAASTAAAPPDGSHQMDRDTEALGAGDGWLERLWTDRNLFKHWFACRHHR